MNFTTSVTHLFNKFENKLAVPDWGCVTQKLERLKHMHTNGIVHTLEVR